ncbi:MAG: hypothetical protein JWN34_356 [Bryobacterales bacterium]|nr:hypothetical protein [Bryobacterales bacterium]
MSRDLVSATRDASQGSVIVPVWLIKLQFDGGTIFLSTYDGPLTWSGDTYIGAGAIGSISPIQEDTELARTTLSMQVRGLPSEIIDIVHNEYFQGRRATTYLGYLDQITRQFVDDPVIMHRGRMDTAQIDESDTCSVTLTVESRFADWDKAKVRRFNDADQKSRFPGDRGLEFVTQAEQGTIWGIRNPT